jgi:hypothetical protein
VRGSSIPPQCSLVKPGAPFSFADPPLPEDCCQIELVHQILEFVLLLGDVCCDLAVAALSEEHGPWIACAEVIPERCVAGREREPRSTRSRSVFGNAYLLAMAMRTKFALTLPSGSKPGATFRCVSVPNIDPAFGAQHCPLRRRSLERVAALMTRGVGSALGADGRSLVTRREALGDRCALVAS